MVDSSKFEKWQYEKILECKLAEMEYNSKITFELKTRQIQQDLLIAAEQQAKI